MPPFDDAPLGRPFLGVPGPIEVAPRPGTPAGRRGVPAGAVTAAALAGVVLIGGAGASYPLLETGVELASLALLAHLWRRRDARPAVDGLEWTLIALALLVPLAQLVPLPAGVWSALPGRALPAAMLAAAGIAPATMPASLAPAETLRAACAMLPGLAFFLSIRAETAAGRRLVARTVVSLAVVSAALGAVQVAAGSATAAPAFQSAHLGQAIGLFVNRNHQAAFLLVALCLTPAAWRRVGSRRVPVAAFGVMALLAAGVIATTSRTALLLLPLCVLPALWPLVRRSLRRAAAVAGGVALLILAGWWQGALPRLLERFGEPELRPDFWRTSWAAARAYFPGGAGLGAFKSVYPVAESRDALTPFVVNHAHDDVLELLLETGVAAVIGLALFAIWYARRSIAARHASVRGPAPAALGAIAVLLAWSSVDYPLRTLSLMAVFGLLCGLASDARPRAVASAGRWRGVVAVVLATALGVVVSAQGLARHRLLAGDARGAVALDPRLTAGWTALAEQAARAGDLAGATADARRALLLTPLDQHAMGLWALSRQRAGDRAAARGWDAAARLGGRDPATQVMLAARDADAGDATAAMARADALLRQRRFDPTLLAMLRLGAGDPRFAGALAATLATGPAWRGWYLMQLADLDATGIARHAALLRTMRAAHIPLRADEVAALVARAQAVGRADVAARGWAMLVAPDRLGDPALARIDASWRAGHAIGGWHRTGLPGLDAAAGGGVLLDRTIAGTLLYQDLFLPAGRYTLDVAVAGDAPLDAETLRWTVTCADGDLRLDDGQAWRDPAHPRLALAVPPGCARQRLALDGTGTGVGTTRLRLQVALTPN